MKKSFFEGGHLAMSEKERIWSSNQITNLSIPLNPLAHLMMSF